jgi:uncharacterized protein YjbI with pentapeptide repeats
MLTDRRNFLANLTMAASLPEICSPGVAASRGRRVSQDELDEAVANHAIWLEDCRRGARAEFPRRDLSGLKLRTRHGGLVNLRGSDFTGADLTGVTGKEVSFAHASLHGADLSCSRFEAPHWSHASLRAAVCDDVVWGWDPASSRSPARPQPGAGAFFHHTDAGGRASFAGAVLRGMFWEASFTEANLTEADFSYSLFPGSYNSQTSFFAADLTRAKFNFAEIAAARFSKGILTDADFGNVDIGYWAKLPDTVVNHT